MKIKTSELIGVALDWAVMTCVKGTNTKHEIHDGKLYLLVIKQILGCSQELSQPFMPSTRWQEGGPLIERFEMDIEHLGHDGENRWCGFNDDNPASVKRYSGPTPLIAAMRTIVAAKLGDEVDVPEGLV